MTDINVAVFDDLDDVTHEEVQDAKRRQLLDKGYYSAAITKITPKVSSSGQAMLIVNYSPCSEPGNPKTQSFRNTLTQFFMLPWLKDKEALRNRLANDKNVDPALVSDTDVDEVWGEKKARALTTLVSDTRVLLGSEKDVVPTKKELVQSSRAADYDEAHVMGLNLAKEAIQGIANGNIDLVGHTRVLYVTQGVFRNEPCNNVSRVLEDLPEGRDYAGVPF